MARIVALNYPAAIPVGHAVEITEFADTRPERKRTRDPRFEACAAPAIVDLDTGIRYMNHAHASIAGNGGNSFRANRYPLAPLPSLTVERVWRARVTACTLVMVEGLESQHTMLELDAPSG
ncbi:hypothetical protein MUN78_08475 [Leucobacter allii]|uniref:Uncharacterized protein n=1 Tax=Leucobacter allii TaxID=2932247 RepID=A0ABY4FIC9_9MICO|nr:hypothetical protein [Leucobacter allii]UOQ55752.1 hypothetical protein MUN78_08475 [Leucobacter allii]UOR00267.1 hypothetical protein MUN77_08715 [Leucobacter allii]